MKLVDKDALVAVIERLRKYQRLEDRHDQGVLDGLHAIEKTIGMNEVRDPYEQRIQYDSIKSGIQAHADTYSFNIESELFNQLTKEQQKLWRKEIEQAVISGGEVGVELARDARYKENLEVKDVDLEKEYKDFVEEDPVYNRLVNGIVGKAIAKHFFELGFKAQKGE